MEISFANHKHEELVNNFDFLCKKYNEKGVDNATDIIAAIDALRAAPSLFDIPHSPFHPHPLSGGYKGSFAIYVTKKERMIFSANHKNEENFRIDNYKSIKSIIIEEIFKDYH